jgi:hypothetical protein
MPEDRMKSLKPGDSIYLRKDALPHVKIRNWTFRGINSHGVILLDHKEKGYILEVKEEDINWEEYERMRGKD